MSDLREIPAAKGEAAPPISRAVWAAAVVMALGSFLANMDSSIVAVGLESMRVSLHTGLSAIQWVATAFLLGLSAALPLTPWLIRRTGAGRLWMVTFALFLLTSAGCALAPAIGVLVGVRGVQGMAAGVLLAAGQTVIGLAVGPERLGRMMGTLGMVVGLAPVVGPSVGGFLLSRFSWPALFWLNLPIGLPVLLLALRFVPRGQRQRPPRMDWPGLALVSVSLPALVYALTELGSPGGASVVPYLIIAAAGLGSLALFGWRSLRARDPVLRLRLAANPVLAASLLTVLLAGASMFGAVLLLPLWFQLRLGLGSTSTGLFLIALGLGSTLIMLVAGRLTDAHGGGVVSLAGSLVVLLSTIAWPWFGPHTPMALIQVLLIVRGAGLGLAMMPATTAAYAAVRPADLGDATALTNIAMRVGGAVGGALCVIVLSRGLTVSVPTGFHSAFIVLAGICLLATIASGWLRNAEKHRTPRKGTT
ncbi:MAG TPA: DHA2 family efflux MFS transporter permease subunit [Pseudonocardiaceae bacterium]|nr:DHA2 family efflux MFS transporter permease subunit [Pseudonocardiaceae bacterium]